MLTCSIVFVFYKNTNNKLNKLENKLDILCDKFDNTKSKSNIHISDKCIQTEKIKNKIKKILAEYKQTNKIKNKKNLLVSSDINDRHIFPNQNHITFPHFFMFNKNNFKHNGRVDEPYKLNFASDDLMVVSNQLAKFMKVPNGTCVDFVEAYTYIWEYLRNRNITQIDGFTSQLNELFGITINEYPKYSNLSFIKMWKKMLEQHLKKITYECSIDRK